MVDLSKYSNEQLFDMVESLNSFSIADDALLREVAREVFQSDEVYINQMMALAVPIATELAKRLKVLRSIYAENGGA